MAHRVSVVPCIRNPGNHGIDNKSRDFLMKSLRAQRKTGRAYRSCSCLKHKGKLHQVFVPLILFFMLRITPPL